MRIVYLHQYFNTLTMPGSTRSFEMARRLVRQGHDVHLITSKREGSADRKKWVQTTEDGIKVYWYPIPYSNEMSYRERLKSFIFFAFKSAEKAAEIKSEVVFATSTPLTIILPAFYGSMRTKAPIVFEVRDLWPEGPIQLGALKNPSAIFAARCLERFAYRSSFRIVTLSPGMKAGVVSTGYPDSKVTVIPNGCDLELFSINDETRKSVRSQHDWLKDRPLVIYTGTVGLVNGVDYLARLAEAVSSIDTEIRFLVLGSGREYSNLKELAIHLGIYEKNFFMIPSIPKKDVPKWLCSADIAVSTVMNLPIMQSYWMDSQNKFFDALAAGKPVASNHENWQTDLLKKHDSILLLDPNNIDSSAMKLAKALNNRGWLENAGRASRRLAEELFDRDKLALELEAVLLEASRQYCKR